MRRKPRLTAAFVLIGFSALLGGCASGGGSFDPSDLLDFLDTKKKIPGDRKPVFPEGVPGLEQGVPKDMYKGAQQQEQDNAQAVAAAAAAEPVADARPKPKPKPKPKPRPAPAASAAPSAVDGEAAQDNVEVAPAPRAVARRRTTAPDQDAAPISPFPR
ncbi:MAG: hypothetical protein FWD68_03925 [Alphaproteobacteria bacterium]|nr:hypothetical protein [Alphaproteobacteria bacterium]